MEPKSKKKKDDDADELAELLKDGPLSVAQMVERAGFSKADINSGDAQRTIRKKLHQSPGITRMLVRGAEKFAYVGKGK